MVCQKRAPPASLQLFRCNTCKRAGEEKKKTPANPFPDAFITFSEVLTLREQPAEHRVKLLVFTNAAQAAHYNLSVLVEASRPFLSISASFFQIKKRDLLQF